MDAASSPYPSVISNLGNLLGKEFSNQLTQLVDSSDTQRRPCFLRVEAKLCPTTEHFVHSNGASHAVAYVDLRSGRPVCAPNITPSPSPDRQAQHLTPDEIDTPIAPTTRQPKTHDTNGPQKRRKVVGGLRLQTSRVQHTAAGNIDESEKSTEDEVPQKQPQKKHLVRQVHSDSRFPVRNAHKEPSVPALTSTSTDKLISGIWRQVHSEVKWSRDSLCVDPTMHIHGGMSREAFRIVNSMCVTYHNQSQSSRALEMVVQAYWVECYEARIVAIELEKPRLSKTEARMIALREACAVLKLTEKDLRNRLAIWRGYKEIKENGGWASLIFAGSGVYRFCKYRIGFNEGLTQRLRQLRHNLEIAADTLHPEWRQLLGVIGQRPSLQYPGHPHEWVAMGNCPAQPLRYTYRHLGQDFLHYQFIDECVVDHNVFGEEDPRRVPEVDSGICPTCHQQQADDICLNRCKCFPNLFGDVKTRPAVQVFQTGNAKNNGVVARLDFERGVAIGEFVGLVTTGIEGVDVMMGGSPEKSYQIFQRQMGNFTRFINHSCLPNSQFQKFYWRGVERILVVSRGIQAGTEITVDYSDHYWKCLEKPCLCGEPCCRFQDRRVLG